MMMRVSTGMGFGTTRPGVALGAGGSGVGVGVNAGVGEGNESGAKPSGEGVVAVDPGSSTGVCVGVAEADVSGRMVGDGVGAAEPLARSVCEVTQAAAPHNNA